jgi:mannose/cellobiose epimerase-like protein (N-acyl-D-glucosamine 2-epimerase family)
MIDAAAECRRLLSFARASAEVSSGFAWLDERGRPDPSQPVHTWITTRMTHVFALAQLSGETGTAALVDHGVRALLGPLRDEEYGGWHASVTAEGLPVDSTKAAYAHAFVVLAAASAVVAKVSGASELLADALDVVQCHFLDDEGRVVDQRGRDLTTPEDYRGANSSMHMVEAFLAAGDVTGDEGWHRRALSIAEHLIRGEARRFGYLLPEHYSGTWQALPDYNIASPADPFRPFGCTPGHLLEWSRLLLHLEATVPDPPAWLCDDARALFEAAVETAWAVDGRPGLVYTVDWQRQPVVRHRMHWVHAEAIAASSALHRRTAEAGYAEWRERFEDYASTYLLDHAGGSWHHELDERNEPSSSVWKGKPDVYHAYQALRLVGRPLAPALAVQLAGGAAPASGPGLGSGTLAT